jgi:hypothetical protein
MDIPPTSICEEIKIVKDEKIKEYTAKGWQNRTIRVSTTTVEPKIDNNFFGRYNPSRIRKQQLPLGWRLNGCLEFALNQVNKDLKFGTKISFKYYK